MITLQELAKRDKWICHICTERVQRLNDATRDHLIPKNFGGNNDNANIALAHKWCNKIKSNKVFRAEQHGTGYVVVDPNNEVVSDEYTTFIEAHAIASEMNKDKVYLDPVYEAGREFNGMGYDEIVVIRRVQDNPTQDSTGKP